MSQNGERRFIVTRAQGSLRRQSFSLPEAPCSAKPFHDWIPHNVSPFGNRRTVLLAFPSSRQSVGGLKVLLLTIRPPHPVRTIGNRAPPYSGDHLHDRVDLVRSSRALPFKRTGRVRSLLRLSGVSQESNRMGSRSSDVARSRICPLVDDRPSRRHHPPLADRRSNITCLNLALYCALLHTISPHS